MRIDLHSHSNRSDGTDSPAELIRRAAAAGLDVLGLTDHDTFAGWDEAVAEADRIGLELLPGVELSCSTGGSSVHLLAYGPDPLDGPLNAELERIRAGRIGRVPAIVESLRMHGIDLEVDDIVAGVSPGRPHVADALVAKGYAPTRREAFDRWLTPGKPGYVTRYAPEPETAIRLVIAAGGVPVLAHPRGRDSATVLTDDKVASFAMDGLAGLEVDHSEHSPPIRAGLRSLAAELDLVVTGSSDYHGHGKPDHALGSETTAPDQYARLRERVMRGTRS